MNRDDLPTLLGLVTCRQAALRLGLHPSTVSRRAARGEFVTVDNPYGPGRLFALDPSGRPITRTTPPNPATGPEQTGTNQSVLMAELPATSRAVVRVMADYGWSARRTYRALRFAAATGRVERRVIHDESRPGRPHVVWEPTMRERT